MEVVDDANQRILNYKKKATEATEEFKTKIYEEKKNVEFSVYLLRSDNKEQLINELPNSAVIYARDDALLDEAYNLLKFKANIGVKVYKKSKKNSKDVLKDFNNGNLNFILSTQYIKFNRENIRAVIFYGIPRHILRIYKETLQVARDKKRAKCIILWNLNDEMYYRQQLYEEPYSDVNLLFCFKLLNDMIIFCKSNQCRRKIMHDLLRDNSPALLNIQVSETCCDNCQRFILKNAPLKLMFKGLEKHSRLHISKDMRIILHLFNSTMEGFTEDECKKTLLGKRIERIAKVPISSFGAGRLRDENFWACLIKAATRKNFLKLAGDKYQITSRGKKFNRLKNKKLKIVADPEICKSLERKKVIISMSLFANKWSFKVQDLKEFPIEYVENDQERTEKIWEPIFKYKPKPQPRLVKKNLLDFDALFELDNEKPVLRKRKIVTAENVVEEKKPKVADWREAFARAAACKNPDYELSNQNALKLKSNEPGCSHWSTTTQQVAENKLNDLSSEACDEENDIDQWMVEEEYCNAGEKMQPLKVPLNDLLDYIENAVASDKE